MPLTSIPIIDQLIHPALGLVTRALVPGGPFSGQGSLVPPQNPLVALTYGIGVTFFTIPTHLSLLVGNPDIYSDRIVQLASVHTLLDAHEVVDEIVSIRWDGTMYFWAEALPTRIQYHVLPGCVVVFHWLQT